MKSFILFSILLIASHAFTAYIAWHEGYLRGWFGHKKDIENYKYRVSDANSDYYPTSENSTI